MTTTPDIKAQIESFSALLAWVEANVSGERAAKSDFPSLFRCRAALATLQRCEKCAPGPHEGHGEPCYYCGEKCNGLAGDPGEWPVPFCHADDPGRVKWHHDHCLQDRLQRCERAPFHWFHPSRWRHKKRGSAYNVLTATAEAQCATGPINEGDHVSVYQGDDDNWYVRKTAEFQDGRFERIDLTEGWPAAMPSRERERCERLEAVAEAARLWRIHQDFAHEGVLIEALAALDAADTQ